MKKPRINDFDPNAKVQELGSPMDNLPSIKLPDKRPESQLSRKDESLKGRKEEILKSGEPESWLSGNQAITNARKPENRKVPKYSTQLEEDLQIQVSIFAKTHRMKDYEVVQCAIEEYLNSHK